MSVVNKMLRDLDRRHAAEVVSPLAGTRGVASVSLDPEPQGRVQRWLPLLLATVLGFAAAAAGLVYFGHGALPGMAGPEAKPPVAVAALVPVVPAVPPVPPLAVQAPVAVPAPATSAPVAVESVVASPKLPDLGGAPKTVAITPDPAGAKTDISSQKTPVIVAAGSTAATAAKPSVPAMPAPAAAPAPVQAPAASLLAPKPALSPVPAAPAGATPPPTGRLPAALETLAQAQNLWNGGSRDAAIELLRDAVAVAERAPALGGGPAQVLVPLVRELARMELVEGRVAQVFDLLSRLEPVLTPYADLWAVRGNAAQRLGRHAESASAYLMALKIRPNEPRWMLGAAVSLAVQGQTAAAAEWAEKARANGALPPELFAYLRQLGVPLLGQ